MIKMRNVGAQTQKKWRPGGPPLEGWGPPLRPPIFALFLSLWGSSRGNLVVFLKAGTLKCARLGSRVVV